MRSEYKKCVVYKDHNGINSVFPLGFETTYYVVTHDEDLISESRMGEDNKGVIYKKGDVKDIIFIGNNGFEYSSDWFYKCTGKFFDHFIERIDK